MRRKTVKVAFRELNLVVDGLLGNEGLSLVERFNGAMPLVVEFLGFARSERLLLGFSDKMEEIYFFKFEKPEYYALKIYVAGWFTLMNGRPRGTLEQLRAYYSEELRFICRFFGQHAFHYQYFRSGMTELDELLFVRGVEVSPVFVLEVPELDGDFCTSGDYLFAKFLAYERLRELIIAELDKLDAGSLLPAGGGGRMGSGVLGAGSGKVLDWTGEVINLVELGYALYVSGQIGGGKASLGEIFRWLEGSFGLEIGIPANRLREIKRRKRMEKLHFLLLLQEALLGYIDKSEGI
ncbi:RteC domain-containing protein [Pedobacter sp.]